jgi:L-histidine Nalpha-methyltransferase
MPSSSISKRVARPETAIQQFASDVQYYLALQPRQLPSRYLYDQLGSALFEAICALPWYPITRAEMRLLVEYGGEIFHRIECSQPRVPTPLRRLSTIVELGGGNGEKLLKLVESAEWGSRGPQLDLHLIDVSATALAVSARMLSALDTVHIVTHQAPYEVGLEEVRRERSASGRMLALFLGSNIGNFDPPGADAFLRAIRASLLRGDGLLIGTDLVKPEADLLLAYDDPLGVTAAFNRNLLVRINRELGGDFDLDAFDHRASWNADRSRVEMHLVSRRRQRVRVPAADLDFVIEGGESIWTESSYKYEPEAVVCALDRAGFRLVEQWIDRDGAFALTLARAD